MADWAPSADEYQIFGQVLDELSAQSGVQLDAEDRDFIYRQSVENGWTPQATLDAFGDITGLQVSFDRDEQGDPTPEFHGADQAPDHLPPLTYGGEPEIDPRVEGDLAFIVDLGNDIDRLTKKVERPLLRAETKAIFNRATEHARRYGDLPEDFAEKALEEHHKAVDWPDTREKERVQFVSQRLWEAENADVEDDASLNDLDLDDPDDRLKWLTARAQGVDFESAENATAEDDDNEPAELEEAA